MDLTFSRKLIRGRITEVIFEQMIRDEKRYTVIPFGYEHTVPTLAQYRHLALIQKVVDNISDAPDFLLISDDKASVYLVEVKFQRTLDLKEVAKHAGGLLKRWNPSWLFIVTPEGFYCGLCKTIVDTGEIAELSPSWVSPDRQAAYLKLLNEFDRC
jgi:hypothetical protein